jgi:hypothetical protein
MGLTPGTSEIEAKSIYFSHKTGNLPQDLEIDIRITLK